MKASAARPQLWAAILAIQTSQMHVTASGDHFAEWWGYGIFFAIVALCQFFGGLALLCVTSRKLTVAGLIGTVAVLAVWAISRTAGIHIGPEGVEPEPVGLLDGLSTGLEVAQVYCLIAMLRAPRPAPLAGLFHVSEPGR